MTELKLKLLRELARHATNVTWSASPRHREKNLTALAEFVSKYVDCGPASLSMTDVAQFDVTWDDIDLDEECAEFVINDLRYRARFSVGFIKDKQTYGVTVLVITQQYAESATAVLCTDLLISELIRDRINEKVSWNVSKYSEDLDSDEPFERSDDR